MFALQKGAPNLYLNPDASPVVEAAYEFYAPLFEPLPRPPAEGMKDVHAELLCDKPSNSSIQRTARKRGESGSVTWPAAAFRR